MKKYYTQTIIASAIIGILVRIVGQIIQGLPIQTNPSDYFISIFIGATIGAVVMLTYTKVLIDLNLSRIIKLLCSYSILTIVFFVMNILFDGISILFYKEVYLILLFIILASLPIILFLENRVMKYNKFLKIKQNNKSL